MDNTVKLTSVSVVLGLIAGVISAIFSIGLIGFKNDVIGLLVGIIIIYALIKSTDKIVDEDMGRSQKIWDCFMPLFFVWIIVWVLLTHYL